MSDSSVPLGMRPTPAGYRRKIPDDAHVTPVVAGDGWQLRSIRWSPPDTSVRGSILFLGGRGDHFEKYLETFEDWRLRGWQVESFDWRGQGGSGRLAADPSVGHANDFGHWVDDLANYFAEWKGRSPGPHVVIGHSMGGHLLLRSLVEQRLAPEAAVLVAPMLGFTTPFPNRLGLWVARMMNAIGKPERAAWNASEKPGSTLRLRQKLLTHDNARYDDEIWWKTTRPDIALGPASWRWVEQAYASFVALDRPDVIESVAIPLLVLAASEDSLVAASATRRVAARLRNCTLHVYGSEAAHELLREADPVREDVLARIDAFLAKAAPLR